jgi:hypothetical protein
MERLSLSSVTHAWAHLSWEARRLICSGHRRFGAWGWALLTCVLAAVLGGAALQHQTATLSDVRQRAAQGQAATPFKPPAAKADQTDRQPTDGRALLLAFERHLLPTADLPLVLQDLLQLAQTHGLVVERGDYRAQNDAIGNFTRYRMTLPVKGPAAQVQAFIQAALLNEKTLALDSVQFKRASIESVEVEARIQWMVLMRASASAIPLSPSKAVP